ncbi:MAG: serine hydrolase [Spirochaetes bacterium]|nr:serine hydrolase [Spirochaetota bacterium]
MSHACAVLVPVMAAALLAAGCSIENKKSRPESSRNPEAARMEARRKARRKAIQAEQNDLTRWLRLNTRYPVVPSAAAIVIDGDRVAYRETVRCEPDTPFRAASLTKTFTAIAILQLADRGILSLNAPVSRYLQVSFENAELRSRPITIWHLLSHTSGLVEDPNPDIEQDNYPFIVPEQKYPAGFRFNYCNQGYNLLGFIVFEASGFTLGEYVTHNILAPMGMNDSKAPPDTRGASGIECSIRDMGKYMVMFLRRGEYGGKRIISERMFRKIVEESVEGPRSRNKEYRGLCFRIWSVDGRIYSMHHAAHMPGSGGFMQIFPRNDCGYAFISNPPVYDRNEYYEYYYALKSGLIRLCGLMMGGSFNPLTFKPDRPTVEQMKRFVGRYRQYVNPAAGPYIDISLHPRGYLVATRSASGESVPIVPTSLHTFVYIYPGQQEKGEIYDFVMRRGKVVGLAVREGYYMR